MKTELNISSSGIAYTEAQDLVETIVSIKKNKYNFPGTDSEDLAQDIRLICWESLNKFDPAKLGKSVFHFVARCVDNALYNKFRGVFLDNNPPCLRCPEYVRETKQCRIDEVGCDRILAYRDRMARKRAVAAPLSYNAQLDSEQDQDFSYHESLSVGSTTGVCDLDDSLRASLDKNLIPYYNAMVDGREDEVPPHFKRIIQRHVRLIIDGQDE